jgi:hypothetical protein
MTQQRRVDHSEARLELAAEAAKSARRQLGLWGETPTSWNDLARLCELAHATLSLTTRPIPDFEEAIVTAVDGALTILMDAGPARDDQRSDPSLPEHDRKRWILAHEIGHLVLHARDAALCEALEREFLSGGTAVGDRIDSEADVFASVLLCDEPTDESEQWLHAAA